MCRSRRNDNGQDDRAGRLDAAYVDTYSSYVVNGESDLDHERWNVDSHLVGNGRGSVRCIRCVVWFESRQRNSERGPADCELEFLARVYGCGRHELGDGNHHGAAGRSSTDPVLCCFSIECGQRWHRDADLEQHWCERLHRERRLDRCATHLRYDNGRSFDDRSDLYIGVHRDWRHGDTLGQHHRCRAESDAYLLSITAECGERRERDIDVGYDQCGELYRVWIVERD